MSVKLNKGQSFENFLDTLNNENKINNIYHEGEEATQITSRIFCGPIKITTKNLRQSPHLELIEGDLTISALIYSEFRTSL